ncbi:aminotransferase class V-fold PLP-dependent enzyme [Sinorhizobium alkalisoli]|uniref:aminotransferase class V-fold PLP-dependent enzyme n=1 Tax=Sinorhizobium alkalisoli TaxID=1752398 RepID=UPI00124C14E7|nr:aminotransferase class V-fold PLP-dependent enzyme [Sinorhizobium alkalisoli]MCA1492108.1 aminotransferase class V-fold PLP-dependent enzyme [Ensifer sp. NBAIM29]MCG5481171.1 aminotransferase class V-fold PLP-dependent enzyme [Sinorhizobium alkalisoli]QFI70144.1 Cysteine desulfurase [Sinorhizobium alkalisoli]
MNTFDVEELRSETPGCEFGVHFNHSGASLPSRPTLETIWRYLHREAVDGPMETAIDAGPLLEDVRADAASLIGATPDEMAFMGSGSAAWGAAFAALPPLAAGDRILVGRQEWGGNLATMQAAAARTGARVETIPAREDGGIDASALANLIDDRVRLVSLTWLPANGGLINDAAAVGCVTKAAGIPYFIDAAQALGQIPIHVGALGCDALTAAGRKFLRGPRGTAILYVRRAFLQRLTPSYLDVVSGPIVDGVVAMRNDARRFEASENSPALLLGLGTAIRQAKAIGINIIHERITTLAGTLRDNLRSIPKVTVRDLGTDLSGIVSFTIDGVPASEIRVALAERQIATGANGVPYTPLDMTARRLDQVARASVSYLNTPSEVALLSDAVAALAARA